MFACLPCPACTLRHGRNVGLFCSRWRSQKAEQGLAQRKSSGTIWGKNVAPDTCEDPRKPQARGKHLLNEWNEACEELGFPTLGLTGIS